MKYVIDTNKITVGCITQMSDGVHCDYTHKTIDELSQKYPKAKLALVGFSQVERRCRMYEKAVGVALERITAEHYDEAFDCLPPRRYGRDWFFVGEPYSVHCYPFLFRTRHGYYRGIQDPTIDIQEIISLIKAQKELENIHPIIRHGQPILEVKATQRKRTNFTPIFFEMNGQRHYICMLPTDLGNKDRNKDARDWVARLIYSLRAHFYQYMVLEGNKDMFRMIQKVSQEDQTLAPIKKGKLLHFVKRIYVDFCGYVSETGERFYYRIYSRDTLSQLLLALKTVYRQ